MSGIPKLRGHHLICLHFFSGKGYNREFIENLRAILDAASERGAKIIEGADDVCRRCPYLKREECLHDEHSKREIMEMDEFALALLSESQHTTIRWHNIRDRIPEIFPSWIERYCKKCTWEGACLEDTGYRELRYGKDSI